MRQDTEAQSLTTDGIIHQEDVTIMNLYDLHAIDLKYINQNRIKEKGDKFIILSEGSQHIFIKNIKITQN